MNNHLLPILVLRWILSLSVKSKLAENLRIGSAVELVVTPHGNHIMSNIGGVSWCKGTVFFSPSPEKK